MTKPRTNGYDAIADFITFQISPDDNKPDARDGLEGRIGKLLSNKEYDKALTGYAVLAAGALADRDIPAFSTLLRRTAFAANAIFFRYRNEPELSQLGKTALNSVTAVSALAADFIGRTKEHEAMRQVDATLARQWKMGAADMVSQKHYKTLADAAALVITRLPDTEHGIYKAMTNCVRENPHVCQYLKNLYGYEI